MKIEIKVDLSNINPEYHEKHLMDWEKHYLEILKEDFESNLCSIINKDTC